MKKIITLIAIFVLVFINTILSADFWEKLQTPEGGVISRLLIDDSGNIYASWGRNRISTVNYTCRGEIYKFINILIHNGIIRSDKAKCQET